MTPMADRFKGTADPLDQYRAGRAYKKLLIEADLWDPKARGQYGLPEMHKKLELQQQIWEQFPGLPFMFLDKAETMLHAEALKDELIEKHSGLGDLTAQDFWRQYWSRPNHDRDLPDLVLDLLEENCFTEEAARELLEHAWVSTEYPEQNGGSERWQEAFDAAGWISDDDSERPTEPMTLYRGATADYALGMAWTADPERAAWFARRFSGGTMDEGHVYKIVVDPRMILARLAGRNEDEYVLWIQDIDETWLTEIESEERFVTCKQGHEHWGLFGAAGILLVDEDWYFLHKRSAGTHEAGLWSTPGGAVRMGETPLAGARREFKEETGYDTGNLPVLHTHVNDHGGWTYTTFLIEAPKGLANNDMSGMNWETSDHGWFTADEGRTMNLHPGLKELWGWTPLDPLGGVNA